MPDYYIIAINPGSTSTKIAVFKNDQCIFEESLKHSTQDLAPFEKITDQLEFRKEAIWKRLKQAEIEPEKVWVIMGRGGLVKPIKSGVYIVDEAILRDLRDNLGGEHASNLGGLIAWEIAREYPNATAYITDPVVVDELEDIARLAGHPIFSRRSVFHALNHKATARKHAKAIGKNYEELELIVVHLGGGISVAAHHQGRVVDVNMAVGGEGPFSPERAGSVPVTDVVKLAYSGKYTEKELLRMLVGQGGLAAYLGTNNTCEVERRVKEGDQQAIFIYDAMAYQVAKAVGAKAVVLKGKVDGILVTGGVAYDQWFVDHIRDRVEWIAPVFVYPGENEMGALAENARRVLHGEITVNHYK